MLGALKAQLQGLQVRLPQKGTVAVYAPMGALTTEQLLWAKMANTVTLPEGALTTYSMENRAAVGWIKGLGLNLAALLLYL